MASTTDGSGPAGENGLTPEQTAGIRERYLLSPADFRARPPADRARMLRRLELGNLPLERALHDRRLKSGADGRIPPDAQSRAMDRMAEIRASAVRAADRSRVAGLSVGAAPAPRPIFVKESLAGLQPDNVGWQWIGPGNIGGRTRSLLINPGNVEHLWTGGAGGGVWRSTSGGRGWYPADDQMADLAISCMVMDPMSPTTIYAGTGEGFFTGQISPDGIEIPGRGIYKTRNGEIWTLLPSTKVTGDNHWFRWVNSLAISSDGSTLLAGTPFGIFRSTDRGGSWTQSFGMAAGNVVFDPRDDSKAIAGLLAGGGALYSTDGGQSWTRVRQPAEPGHSGRTQVCYSAKDSSVAYASVEWNPAPAQLWRSTDGGVSYTKMPALSDGQPVNFLVQGSYDNVIWAGDPTDENLVVVGGVRLWRSTDGGNTLTVIGGGGFLPLHADQHVIVASPKYDGKNNLTVFVGNDGGVFKTDNIRTVEPLDGWTSLNNDLGITQFYSGAANATSQVVVGGTQDNGTLLYTPGSGANGWIRINGGDGGYVASDPDSTTWQIGESQWLWLVRYAYGSGNDYGDQIMGHRGDGTWKPSPYTLADTKDGKCIFIAPVLLDPNVSHRLLAGGAGLWRTDDVYADLEHDTGPMWTLIKPEIGNCSREAKLFAGCITAIAVAPGHSNVVVVGHSNGQIFKTVNAITPPGSPYRSPTWRRIDNGTPQSRCSWLAIDHNDRNVLYATFSDWGGNSIWKSIDGGSSWSSIGSALPHFPVYCITIHPHNSDWLYVGTDFGVFASGDGGGTWSPANEGPNASEVRQLFWQGSTLLAATYGRGLYRVDLTVRQTAALVIVADTAGVLTALDPVSGTVSSTYALANGEIIASPLIDGTNAYCGLAQPSKVILFDAGDLASGPVWEVQVDAAVNATPDMLGSAVEGERSLFVATAGGKVYAFDPDNQGALRWFITVVPEHKIGTGVMAFSSAVMNRWVYIATDKGLYAVDSDRQRLVWSREEMVCAAAPLLASSTVFVPTADGKLHAVDAQDGQIKWTADIASTAVSSTPVWILGSVIVGDDSGNLTGLDFETGDQLFRTGFQNQQIKALVADGDELFFVGNGAPGNLYGYRQIIDGADRSVRTIWSDSPRLNAGSTRPPRVVGDTVYLTNLSQEVMAFDASIGVNKWTYSLGSDVVAAPAVVYA